MKNNARGFFCTYDNPLPANSAGMLRTMNRLGRVIPAHTKTSFVLVPRRNVSWRRFRRAIVANLAPLKGNATYTNTRSGRVFTYGRRTGYQWQRIR